MSSQDSEHLESQNANFLAVIDGNGPESESDFDDSVVDKHYEPPCEIDQEMLSSVQTAPTNAGEPIRNKNPDLRGKS